MKPILFWSIVVFIPKSMNEVWDILEWLTGDTYKFEELCYVSRMSLLDLWAFHVRSYYEEQFVKVYGPRP